MLETPADRAALLAGLGGEVIELDGAQIVGIFQDPHELVQLGDARIDANAPELTVRSADLDAMTDLSVFRIRDVDYGISSVQPDGTGMTVVRLVTLP